MRELTEEQMEAHRRAGALEEVWDGVPHMSPDAGSRHQQIIWKLTVWLDGHWIVGGDRGGRSGGNVVRPGLGDWLRDYRIPDLSLWTGNSRHVDRGAYFDGAPEVSASAWNRLDDAHKRAYLVDAYAKLTARIDITDRGNGRFAGTGDQVHKLTLWLEKEQLGKDGKVELRVGSKTHKKIGVPAAEVLLRDFVERLDRTRLPVARIDVP